MGYSKSFALILIVMLALSILILTKQAFAQTPTPTPTPTPSHTTAPTPTTTPTPTATPGSSTSPSSSPSSNATPTPPIPTPIPTPPPIYPKPSIPEFTVQPVGPSFDVPPTYSLDQNTGLFDTTNGYHVEYSAVDIIIKNQPFSTSQSGVLSYYSFYYNVRIKPHGFPDNYWDELFNSGGTGYPSQSPSSSTIIPLPVEGAVFEGITIPTGAQTDIQVEAMIGYIGRNASAYLYPYVFFGGLSGWSNTQTVTLPANIPLSPTPTMSSSPSSITPTPTLTSVSSASYASLLLTALVVIVFLLAVIVFLLLHFRKTKTH